MERLPQLLEEDLKSGKAGFRHRAELGSAGRFFTWGAPSHYAIAREGGAELKESAYVQRKGYPPEN